MAKFIDKLSRDWEVRIDIAVARRLRENCDPPIKITDSDSLATMLDDIELQYVAMWEICKAEAEKRNVDAEQFAAVFTDAYESAAKALEVALKDFFQSLRKAEFVAIVERTLSVSAELQSLREKKIRSQKATELINLNIRGAELEMDKALDEMIQETSTLISS